jgi:hypothetical protein
MHENWRRIEEKWPHYQVGNADANVVDVSQCVFCGEGKHEFAVYTFGRYRRLAERQSALTYPICIRFGIHFPGFVSDEEPAIGHIRTSVSNNTTGMPEPALLLAVVACDNGRAYWDALWKELAEEQCLDMSWPSARWISSNAEKVLAAVQSIPGLDLPAFVEESPPGFCGVVISADDLPPEQFVGCAPDETELSLLRNDNWIYPLKQEIKKGRDGRQAGRERVVLNEDLRRVDQSLFKGQLGWTVPDPGFTIRKGSSSLWIEVLFDTGVQVPVNVYWIDFLREEYAQDVANKIIASYRNTPFDADSNVAAKWHRDLPFYVPSETRIVGHGLDDIYGYSYISCMDEAAQNGAQIYPMKIGYTSGLAGALERINGQFPRALVYDVRVQFIGRCNDGQTTETKIQKQLKLDGRKIDNAPGKEWFLTNAAEVEELFTTFR